MRKFITLLVGVLLVFIAEAQNITTAEYFFDDNDNGFGNKELFHRVVCCS